MGYRASQTLKVCITLLSTAPEGTWHLESRIKNEKEGPVTQGNSRVPYRQRLILRTHMITSTFLCVVLLYLSKSPCKEGDVDVIPDVPWGRGRRQELESVQAGETSARKQGVGDWWQCPTRTSC